MNGKVNIYELAEITGFSSSTVSNSINNIIIFVLYTNIINLNIN